MIRNIHQLAAHLVSVNISGIKIISDNSLAFHDNLNMKTNFYTREMGKPAGLHRDWFQPRLTECLIHRFENFDFGK